MGLIKILKDWWNEPSWEEDMCIKANEALNDYQRELQRQRKIRQDKLNSYESMSERQLLIEIAKNTLKEVK